MKGLALFVLLALCARMTAQGQNNSIHGVFETNKFNGKTLFVKTYDFEKKNFQTIDSIVVKDQKFVYTKPIKPAQSVYFFQENKGKIAWGGQVIAGEGTANMHVNIKGEVSVAGTPSNDKLQQFKNQLKPWEQKMFDTYGKASELQAVGNYTSKTADSIDNIATGYIRKNRLATLNFVTQNIENAAGQSLVPEIMNLPNDILEGIIVGLDSKYQEIPAVHALSEKINAPKRLRYGQPAQNFRVEDLQGKVSLIKELMPKGKTVLIDFWASWCIPCIKSMPHLKELQNKYRDKGFEIIGISIDEKEEAWKKKVAELQLPWAQYLDAFEEGANKYLVNAIPYTVLIAPDGTIIDTKLSGEELDERLKKIFENK